MSIVLQIHSHLRSLSTACVISCSSVRCRQNNFCGTDSLKGSVLNRRPYYRLLSFSSPHLLRQFHGYACRFGRVFSSRSNPKSALALSFIEEAEDGAESFDRRCFLWLDLILGGQLLLMLHYPVFRQIRDVTDTYLDVSLEPRGDGEACAAEGRSGRFGSDDDDSSVAKTIGAVLSRRHSLVEGFGNPRGCHQRHDGESGVAGDEQYRLSSGRGPGFEGALRGHGSPRHQQQDHHKELVIPGLATCSHVKHGIKLLVTAASTSRPSWTLKSRRPPSLASRPWRRPVAVSRPCTTTGWHCARCTSAEVRDTPQPARPNPRKLTYYTNYGYLSLEIQVKKALANASNSE
ncbi:hypothetical protein GQ600_21184 [Phytophthora cactorum]|nr:hypothetical protein GQ600_21184 [Phytophthora cactorum]